MAASAFAWMGLKERSIPLWLGIFGIVQIIPSWGMMIDAGLPDLPAISALWMVIAFGGMALHKGAIRAMAQTADASSHAGPNALSRPDGFAQA